MRIRTSSVAIVLALIAVAIFAWLSHRRTVHCEGDEPKLVVPTRATTEDPEPAMQPLSSVPARPPAVSATREVAPVVSPVAVGQGTDAATALLRVRVVSKETRAPQAEVIVYAIDAGGEVAPSFDLTPRSRGKASQFLTTDADGRVEIESPAGVELDVIVQASETRAGSGRAHVEKLAAGSVREVVIDVATARDQPFWLRVVADETRTPIADAVLRIPGSQGGVLHTDARGLVLYEGRSWSVPTMSIEAGNRAKVYVRPEPGHERVENALEIRIPRASRLTAHVRSPAGAPIEGVLVELTTPSHNLAAIRSELGSWGLPDGSWKERTDAEGIAMFDVLPPGVPLQARVTSLQARANPGDLSLAPGEDRRVDWTLSLGCDVHGIVLDQRGNAVTRQQVWLRPAEGDAPAMFEPWSRKETESTQTDDRGRFRFQGVGGGTWWIGPAALDRRTKPGPDDIAPMVTVVEVPETASSVEVTIRADRGLFIRGRVLDAQGQPCTRGTVNAFSPSLRAHATADLGTDPDGFVIGPLPSGRYQMVARAVHQAGDAPSELVEADAGADGVVLRLRAGNGVSGHVVGEDGQPISASTRIAKRGPKGPEGWMGKSPRDDGSFSFDGLVPGTYDLMATTTGGSVGILAGIEVGTDAPVGRLEIRVHPGGQVRIRHEGEERMVAVQIVQQGIVVAYDGIERGKSRELTVPPGPAIVRLRYIGDDPRTVERTVEVRQGETVDLVFEKGAR